MTMTVGGLVVKFEDDWKVRHSGNCQLLSAVLDPCDRQWRPYVCAACLEKDEQKLQAWIEWARQ